MDACRAIQRVLLAMGATLLASGGAWAQPSGSVQPADGQRAIERSDTGIDDSGQYRKEVEACMSGRTAESRDTCLKEARNAQSAREHGTLQEGKENYQANATARCQPLQGEYQAACEARIMGFGDKSGSVAGGGVLRSVETVVVPPGARTITIVPQTSDPVVLVPRKTP